MAADAPAYQMRGRSDWEWLVEGDTLISLYLYSLTFFLVLYLGKDIMKIKHMLLNTLTDVIVKHNM